MAPAKKPQGSSKKESKTALERHEQSARSASVAPAQGSPKTPTTPKTPSRKKGAAPKSWNHTHIPPLPEERGRNGRQEGRNLITWTRPRMAEKLLLHIQYECSRHKIELPWDAIAHRLHPGSSGGAVLQHMNRLRGHLVAEGHLVPPICQKPGSRVKVDPLIRGYVRSNLDGSDCVTTRSVTFSEPMDDRRFNIPDAYDDVKVVDSAKRESQGSDGVKGTSSKTPKKKATKSRAKTVIKTESPDPTDLDGDADYDPDAVDVPASRRRSSRGPKSNFSYRDPTPSDEEDQEMADADSDQSSQDDSGSEDGEGYPPSYASSTQANYDDSDEGGSGANGNSASGSSHSGDGYEDAEGENDFDGSAGDSQHGSVGIDAVDQEDPAIKFEASSPGTGGCIQAPLAPHRTPSAQGSLRASASPTAQNAQASERAQYGQHAQQVQYSQSPHTSQYSLSPQASRTPMARQASQVPQSPFVTQPPTLAQYFPTTQYPQTSQMSALSQTPQMGSIPTPFDAAMSQRFYPGLMNPHPYGYGMLTSQQLNNTDGSFDCIQPGQLNSSEDISSYLYDTMGYARDADDDDEDDLPSVSTQTVTQPFGYGPRA